MIPCLGSSKLKLRLYKYLMSFLVFSIGTTSRFEEIPQKTGKRDTAPFQSIDLKEEDDDDDEIFEIKTKKVNDL